MKFLVYILNISAVCYMAYIAFDDILDGSTLKPKEYLALLLYLIGPLLTLIYLFTNNDSNESIIGLWFKVKKKNLKDQLK